MLVFFGSGPVAGNSLAYLLDIFDIEAVVTKSRKHKNDPNLVEDIARRSGLRVDFANTKNELDQLFNTREYTSDVGLVIDYGVIISQNVISRFKHGILNSHFSLLPKWRGADPITFSLLNGDTDTGVSLMLINEKLDEGDIIAMQKIVIFPNDNSDSLTTRLISTSNKMLGLYLPKYVSGNIRPAAQSTSITPTYSRKISAIDKFIDPMNMSATDIFNHVRAMYSWPKTHFIINNIDIVLTNVTPIIATEKTEISKVFDKAEIGSLNVFNKKLYLICKNKTILEIINLKPVSKADLDARSFINGYAHLLTKHYL